VVAGRLVADSGNAHNRVAHGAGEPAGGSDPLVSGVCLNSREVRPGDLYAGLPGARVHGASFAAAAVAAGAVAILTDPAGSEIVAESGVEVPVLVVPSPRAVLGKVAALVYRTEHLPLTLFGITGTNGKTTTAYLLASALEALHRHTGMIGTVETRIGGERLKSVRTTPEATDLHALLAVMVQRGTQACVMEVSSHALAQHRVDGVVYDLALFTNLSQDHLDFHGSMRDYFEAKAALFTPERSRRGVVCVDDGWGRELVARAGIPVTSVASDPAVPADWRVEVVPGDAAAFTLEGGGHTLRLRSALPGDFNRVNTALAAVALTESGVPPHEAARVMAADAWVPGRMERVVAERIEPGPNAPEVKAAEPELPLAIVDYAHTPEAVAVALAALRPETAGALVVVLGAGGDRDRGKRGEMGAAAAKGADIVFVTDDNPRSEDPGQIRAAVLEGARAAGTAARLHDVASRSEAIRRAVAAAAGAGPGSTVAVVGKGHETGQEVAGTVHPFDDRAELLAALREMLARQGTAP
jgi:UDP-N-acetylmuramoyl-L-alanyl-D-glutamate--2,6-diaminopimelate ligase